MKHAPIALPLALLLGTGLAACSQTQDTSEQMEEVAQDLVDVVTQSPTPDAELALAGPYAPRNECGGEEGAHAFLAALGAAVELRDTDLMAALAAEDIKLDFGGGEGVEEFRLRLESESLGLWEELEQVVSMGCAVNRQGGITLPLYFAKDIDSDPYETVIVAGQPVFVHAGPAPHSSRIADVSWQALEVIGSAETPDGWVHVALPEHILGGADEGYVRAENLRSVIDYRLIASSRNGRWRITAFIAGD